MSISVFTGTPGTGKSAHAAAELRFQLSRSNPRPVIANFPINPDAVKHPELFTYMPNEQITADSLRTYAQNFWADKDFFREGYITLVLDEVQIFANARRWADKDRLSLITFLSQHRKFGYDVIMIAQSAKMIDNQFRYLIEYEYNHRRVENMGLIGGIVGIPFHNRAFMYVQYLFQNHERLGSSWYLLRKKDLAVYDTYNLFNQTAASSAVVSGA